jgi:hypothetical protein
MPREWNDPFLVHEQIKGMRRLTIYECDDWELRRHSDAADDAADDAEDAGGPPAASVTPPLDLPLSVESLRRVAAVDRTYRLVHVVSYWGGWRGFDATPTLVAMQRNFRARQARRAREGAGAAQAGGASPVGGATGCATSTGIGA